MQSLSVDNSQTAHISLRSSRNFKEQETIERPVRPKLYGAPALNYLRIFPVSNPTRRAFACLAGLSAAPSVTASLPVKWVLRLTPWTRKRFLTKIQSFLKTPKISVFSSFSAQFKCKYNANKHTKIHAISITNQN